MDYKNLAAAESLPYMIITDKDGLTIRRIAIFYKFDFLWELNLYGHTLSSFLFSLLKIRLFTDVSLNLA